MLDEERRNARLAGTRLVGWCEARGSARQRNVLPHGHESASCATHG